jgi:SAM-dependent methyltransferase
MRRKFDVQAAKERYSKDYDTLPRFISYFYQIDSILREKPGNILIVGIGNNLVGDYLKKRGLPVKTCDFDKTLKPDVVADIRSLPFKDNSFDVAVAFEVLEHIPFKDIEKALNELRRVSRKAVIISLPYSCFSLEFILNFHFPLMARILRFFVALPYTFIKTIHGGEHYWEMGRKDYPKKKVKSVIKKYFSIKKEFNPIMNPYHSFFVLRKLF